MKSICIVLGAFVALSACAATSVTPVARNQIIISTSAAPACGRSGATKVAARMAAVETLRRGFQRYIIAGVNAQNNTRVVTTGPTYASTTATAQVYGGSAYGQSTTHFGGQQTFVFGAHDADLGVVMFNSGDPGYKNAVDAKTELGADWEKLVKEGIRTCS